jgi:peptide/nickel transport system permease protein
MVRTAPLAAASVFVLVIVAVAAMGAPWLAPRDPTDVRVDERLRPPMWVPGGSAGNVLGTDSLGRDVLSVLIHGSRLSMVVAVTVVLISGAAGVLLGLISGYAKGYVDEVIMRIADIQLAFPFLLLAIAILAVIGQGLVNVIAAIALWTWVPYARVVRAQTLALREMEFVEAARALGSRPLGILKRHILPNTWSSIIVMASFAVANTILVEGSLSFLGLGIPSDVPTWGGALAEGRDYLAVGWWAVTFPGLAIMLTVLAINVVGEWVRDEFDPRLRI